eukprot:3786836-Rhodomonas_salina.2
MAPSPSERSLTTIGLPTRARLALSSISSACAARPRMRCCVPNHGLLLTTHTGHCAALTRRVAVPGTITQTFLKERRRSPGELCPLPPHAPRAATH